MEVSVVFSIVFGNMGGTGGYRREKAFLTSLELSYQWRREGECRRFHGQGDGTVHLGTNHGYVASVSFQLLCAMLASSVEQTTVWTTRKTERTHLKLISGPKHSSVSP